MDYFQGKNIWLLALSIFWALPWKGFALWRAAKLKHKRWFIAILILNTMAILEIVYLLFFNKIKKEQKTWLVGLVRKRLKML